MADWKSEVRSRLRGSVDDEVVSELASYLEDLYQSDRAQGMSEVSATGHCLDEASQITGVARRITNAKRKGRAMNDRVRSFWAPTLITVGSASVLLMAMQRLGVEPRVFWRDGLGFAVYLPWLIALPLCGAVGAYLSRRAGGSLGTSLAAGLSPAILMFAFFCLGLPVGVVIDRIHNQAWSFNAIGFLIVVCIWALAPALALCVGAAPVSSWGLHKDSRAASATSA